MCHVASEHRVCASKRPSIRVPPPRHGAVAAARSRGGGCRRARVVYADSHPPPPLSLPPWKLVLKCWTISAKGALGQICLNH